MHKIIQLKNNARFIQTNIQHSHIIHCGIMINSGSRDETKQNNGIAHFIEHSVFKGTSKRKSDDILSFIEDVGGELNAFTTRERTCYYASCLSEYADRAVDIICDIAFNATFPEKEIQKEKKVIIEEIEMYDDTPDESIHDVFYEHLFGKHSLGFNILGSKKSVNALQKSDIKTFKNQYYVPSNIVLSIAGNLSFSKGEKLARKYLSHLDGKNVHEIVRVAPSKLQVFEEFKKTDFTQSHCMIGTMVFGRHDHRRYALAIINNILGAAGMSSRLNMSVREKHGLTYSISSNYSTYFDTGVFTIYFACDKKNVNQCRDLINKELDKLCKQKLSPEQLQKAKLQLMGQSALMEENHAVKMQLQARSLLDFGKYVSYKDFLKKVEKVTAEEIQEICNSFLRPEHMSSLIYESA